HHLLILHGRYTCIARKPLCPACVINELCEYKHKTQPAARMTAKLSNWRGSNPK
ncbi:MAG: hypothetical protein ABIR48_08050, partial [Gammaproteobacteria bacterium]